MALKMRFLAVLCFLTLGSEGISPVDDGEIPLRVVIDALRRILVYFEANVNHLNLDGVMGPRIAEGQLNVLLRRLMSADFTPMIISTQKLEEINSLIDLLRNVIRKAVPRLIVNQPNYYRSLSPTIDAGRYELNYPLKKTNPYLVWPVVSAEETMNETMSDFCLSQMLGSGRFVGHPCSPSDNCWGIMTRSGTSLYSLTHQVLFLQLGETMGCWDAMKAHVEQRSQGNLWTLRETFCANILREVRERYAHGISGYRRDLFMEQAAFCGMYGYYEFFTFPYLRSILSWQKPIGCYPIPGVDDYYLKDSTPRRHLVKREEHEMLDGCSAHMSSVAIAVLASYIRFLVEDPSLTGKSRLDFN